MLQEENMKKPLITMAGGNDKKKTINKAHNQFMICTKCHNQSVNRGGLYNLLRMRMVKMISPLIVGGLLFYFPLILFLYFFQSHLTYQYFHQ